MRDSLAKISDYPGPGNYQQGSTNGGPYITMKGRDDVQRGGEAPGPGEYSPQAENHSPSYKVGNAVRINTLSKVNGPGPGSYSVNGLSKSTKWSFGRAKKDELKANLAPGPGSYETPSKTDPRAYSLGGKIAHPNAKTLKNVPGPADYSPNWKNPSPQFSISKGNRSYYMYANRNPGPGTYEPKTDRSAGLV